MRKRHQRKIKVIARKVLVFLFSILIYVLAIHKVGDIIRPGLDESYV
ncbi:Uncharacterized protein NV38_0003736, partial [Leptospira kirschneri serovar Mozdok]